MEVQKSGTSCFFVSIPTIKYYCAYIFVNKVVKIATFCIYTTIS